VTGTQKLRAALLAALSLAGACAPTAPPGATAAGTPQTAPPSGRTPPPRSEKSSAPLPSASARADVEVASALALVEKVRQLPSQKPVPGLRMGRAELRQEVERTLTDEAPAELVAGNTELLYALDLVTESFKLQQALTQLYGAQLAGFYDPDTKRMVLASDLSEDEQALTLYHELVHALQDQHYDLSNALDWKPELSDVQSALQALAEGDAMLAMLDVARTAAGQQPVEFPAGLLEIDSLLMQAKPELTEVPGFLVRAMISPYADGLRFVSQIRGGNPSWAAVDRAWRERPISTEQILHPDKYLAREPVVPVAAIAAPAGFGATLFRDVMGELGLRLLFEEWAPSEAAALAATGWGGDRLAIFGDGERRVVLWHLVFDDEASSRRALTLFARGALRPELEAPVAGARPRTEAGAAERATSSDRWCSPRARRGPFAIVRHGRHLGVTLGPYRRGTKPDASADTCPASVRLADGLSRQR
jgi:hypothetical protein